MQNTISLFTFKKLMVFKDTKAIFRFFQHYTFQQPKVWCSSFQEDHSKEFTRYLRLLCDWVLNASFRIPTTGLTLSAQGLLVGHTLIIGVSLNSCSFFKFVRVSQVVCQASSIFLRQNILICPGNGYLPYLALIKGTFLKNGFDGHFSHDSFSASNA